MSAVVCGKRSFQLSFEDSESQSQSQSPPVSHKRFRCSSAAYPVRFSPPPASVFAACNPSFQSPPPPPIPAAAGSPLERLIALYPGMDKSLLEKTLEDCSFDLDAAITSLSELRLDEEAASEKNNAAAPEESNPHNVAAEWVELFVKEMMSATSVDDAKVRASNAMQAYENSVKEPVRKENNVLKRAVLVQHKRLKEFEEVKNREMNRLKQALEEFEEIKNRETNQLKQALDQQQEQLRQAEMNNYALMMHIRQADYQQNCTSSALVPGRFNPDVF